MPLTRSCSNSVTCEDFGSREIADRLRRPQTSVCRSLNRIRQWLLECIQMELARQEHSGGSFMSDLAINADHVLVLAGVSLR